MNKRSKRRLLGLVMGLVVLVLLTGFRWPLVFAFQRMRLSQLGCPAGKPVSVSAPVDHLPVCEKLWVHRNNSLERFQYMSHYFAGLETDVVFDPAIHNFRVYHPPAPPSNLFLDVYLKALKAGNKGLWLDVKEIDSAACDQAVDYFITCDRLYQIKKYAIIEASLPRFINRLAAAGFTTSYYVPAPYLNPDTPVRVTDSLQQQLAPAVKFISQEDVFLPAMRARFHNRKFITWALSFKNYFNLSHVQSLINDTSISVVLINCKSKGYL